ncbi:MAG: hydrogenase expression/formation protein HypE [Proteobacteria bacterium]|nr:hydrogenase expression/formation protein HypE [Pseudomonadota bacterium]MBU1648534.1 hydrogenase expression/formation protein HypE [Pseudomonadota bacterium]MBU1986702.1 hydrogenase expression/formation protein HypE [Pseudomonadota bacterium]
MTQNISPHRAETILLDHGSGGLASQELISSLFLKHLGNKVLSALEDSAVMENQPGRLAFTTDSYVVDPIFFPGGDIGTLAVHGTINDLAMRGARPLCLSLGLILEEGLPLADLERIIISIRDASLASGVPIVTGDTKVVPRGKADKIFINTSGIGLVADGVEISATRAQAGDKIILSGSMGDHGITIMTRRAGIALAGDLRSDSMALHSLIRNLLAGLPECSIHTLRDPTRGGVATTLCEIAGSSGLMIEIEESRIPVRSEVRAACEILGLDPLYLANEGKCLALVASEVAEQALALMQACPEGAEAAIIGTVTSGGRSSSIHEASDTRPSLAGDPGRVALKTTIGGTRVITPLHGAPLPRIC